MKKKKNDRCTIKVRLRDLLYDDIDYTKLYKCINNTNQIIHNGYLFMRSFILHVIETNKYGSIIEEPVIDENFIRIALKVLNATNTKGRPINNNYINILNDYKHIFMCETNCKSKDMSNLSYILGQAYECMYTSIINNILYHYEKYIWKYIKCSFNDIYVKALEDNDKERKEKLLRIMNNLRDDILLETNKSTGKYKEWLNKCKVNIIPSTYSIKSFETDVNKNTFSYLKCMHYISNYIQQKGFKSYQFFPLMNSTYQKYVKINTSALIDIFVDENKNKTLGDAGNTNLQEKLWNTYFNLKKNNKYKYKFKGFSFNYEIMTDGFGASLNFINNDEIIKKEKAKENKRQGRINTNKLKKEDNYEELLKIKEDKKLVDLQKQKELEKEKRKEKQKAFKKLSIVEQEEIKSQMNTKKEFPNIEHILKNKNVRDKFQKDFDKGKILVCDPGKRSILYLMATNKQIHVKKKDIKCNNFGISIWNDRKIMNYTSKTRIKLTKRNIYNEKIESWKNKLDENLMNNLIERERELFKNVITVNGDQSKRFIRYLSQSTINRIVNIKKTFKEVEKEMSLLNSKSCNYNHFIKYAKKKIEFNKKVREQYDDTYLKRLKWYLYLNKQKHENMLLNIIENEFGKDITIIIGDWSNNCRLKFVSTPNLSIKRKLKERFKVYEIDEYRTSIMHYKHDIKCDNISVPIKSENKPDVNSKNINVSINSENKRKKLHSVLSFKIDCLKSECKSRLSGCINRDKNSVLNMERIVKELIKSGKRLPLFSRDKSILPKSTCV